MYGQGRQNTKRPVVFVAGSHSGGTPHLLARLFLGTSLSWGRRLLSTCPIRGIPYLTDDSLLMMSPTGRIKFRSFLCFSIWHDCAVTDRMKSRRIMNNSVPQWLRERKYEGSSYQTGTYLSKLSFNGFKLDPLVDCPGNVISFKWFWNISNCWL